MYHQTGPKSRIAKKIEVNAKQYWDVNDRQTLIKGPYDWQTKYAKGKGHDWRKDLRYDVKFDARSEKLLDIVT